MLSSCATLIQRIKTFGSFDMKRKTLITSIMMIVATVSLLYLCVVQNLHIHLSCSLYIGLCLPNKAGHKPELQKGAKVDNALQCNNEMKHY